jgi:AraC-like DNA-binding protein
LRGLARIRQDAEHHLAVMITRGGRETVGAGSALVDLGPGDAVVWDSSQPARFTVRERLHKQTLIIPPAALRDVPGGTRVVGGTVLCGNAPAVRLLSGFLGLLLGNSDGFTAAAASAARAAALELVVAAARDASTPVSSALGRSLRPLMDTWIDHHLTTGEITPAALAAAHAVSVRTVHRLFAESGETVGGVVRSRRLARARRELLEENHPVADIAMRWGFADASHFTRLFRQEYGCTPSDARRGGER